MADDHPHSRFEISPLFVGILGILCGAVIVAAFHCIAMGWCSNHRAPRPQARPSRILRPIREDQATPSTSRSSDSMSRLVMVYKYSDNDGSKDDGMCAVCLSEFSEGEEVRVLPECAHTFHVPCIDMWLHSHSNCPLCRADAAPPPPPPPSTPPEHVVVSLPNQGRVSPAVISQLPEFGVGVYTHMT